VPQERENVLLCDYSMGGQNVFVCALFETSEWELLGCIAVRRERERERER